MASIKGYKLTNKVATEKQGIHEFRLELDGKELGKVRLNTVTGERLSINYVKDLNIYILTNLLQDLESIVLGLGGRHSLAIPYRTYMDSFEQCGMFLSLLLLKLNELESAYNKANTVDGFYTFIIQKGGVTKETYQNGGIIEFTGRSTIHTDYNKATKDMLEHADKIKKLGNKVSGACILKGKFNFDLGVDDYLSLYDM